LYPSGTPLREVSVVPVLPIVVAALAVLVACVALFHLHRVRRALVAERAARRLAAGMQARDMDAFRDRVNALLQDRAVLTEAEQILDSALAIHHNPEGGSK
jgi:HAMP domain-containing protein